MLVDSHCHLDRDEFAGDLDGVLARARAAGVGVLQTISTRVSDADRVLAVAARDPDVWCSVGVHPHHAAEEGDVGAERLAGLAEHPDVIGIGETGLDYHYGRSPRDDQRRSFREHIRASRETGLPLIVHARDADADTVAMLEEEHGRGAFPGLIHCFTAGPELARAALGIGFSISFSGIVTFRNAEAIRGTAREVPLDRLLVETDAPFLAPVPHRGRRCEPAFVADTAAFLAGLRGMEADALAEATTGNFFRLFRKARPPAGA